MVEKNKAIWNGEILQMILFMKELLIKITNSMAKVIKYLIKGKLTDS